MSRLHECDGDRWNSENLEEALANRLASVFDYVGRVHHGVTTADLFYAADKLGYTEAEVRDALAYDDERRRWVVTGRGLAGAVADLRQLVDEARCPECAPVGGIRARHVRALVASYIKGMAVTEVVR